ncbi:tRNA glutamyl-Q(34) synthetase GluQRS [Guyparkeria sp.]|uniref:tRNA glutamyl-Q(34) synthetase GluQRS n=1 Tax=Guyparkeria sp. TaxID=2035736 RepID=UPI0035668917
MTSGVDSKGNYHGRFAPTPSGPLHAGSMVAALGSFLDARAHGGRWSVRIDDTDQARCRPESVDEILSQLRAHHLLHDGDVVYQSRRTVRYEGALAELEARGRLYRCRCTRARLRDWARAQGQTIGAIGPVYPGFCRAETVSSEERHALRFSVMAHERSVIDRRLGSIRQEMAAEVGDPVLRRADGPVAYHLANVVDDAEMAITHVVRGEDLAELSPLHVELTEALGLASPAYLHLPVLMGPDGRKLSKTNHAPALENRRAKENLKEAAAALGLESDDPAGRATIAQLLERWIGEWRARHVPGG